MRVAKGDAFGELRPYEHGFRVEAEIEFDHPLIGKQALALDIEPDTFRREIARARTFGFMKDVAKLWSAGYALGASFDNTLVISEDRVLNPEGLRFADEFVRHKVLDAIGDLALAGQPLLGGLPDRARRPQAQPRGAVGADGRSDRLAGGRGAGRRPSPPSRSAGRAAMRMYAAGLVAAAYGAGSVLKSFRIFGLTLRLNPGRMSA